ncbi:MAG: hypothetical protein WB686_01010 [Pseudolabrys sp.]
MRKFEMHKDLVIAFALTSSAGVQSASAAAPKCVPVNCHVYNGTHGPVYSCDKQCTQTPTAQGVRAPQTSQQQKNKRMN